MSSDLYNDPAQMEPLLIDSSRPWHRQLIDLAQTLAESGVGQRLRQAFTRLRGARLVVVPVLPLALPELKEAA